jgi:hypothetical protein
MNIKFEYGLIRDIKNADDGRHEFSSTQIQVFYDVSTGVCWGRMAVGNESIVYNDPNVITVAKLAGEYTRKDIAEIIDLALAYRGV